MQALLKQQAEEKKDLAAGVYETWVSLRNNERQIHSLYDNDPKSIPASIQEKMDKARTEYFAEWGSQGRLAVMMEEVHAAQRKDLVSENSIDTQLKDRAKRKKDNDQGR